MGTRSTVVGMLLATACVEVGLVEAANPRPWIDRGPASSGDFPDVDAFARASVRSMCRALIECSWIEGTYAECVHAPPFLRVEAKGFGALGAWVEAVHRGDATFDAGAAARCVAAIDAVECGYFASDLTQMAACRGVVQGLAPETTPCASDVACVEGTFCSRTSDSACPGQCTARGRGQCVVDAHCPDGQVCLRPAENAPTECGTIEQARDSYCRRDTLVSCPGTLVCVSPDVGALRCRAFPALGEACRNQCERGAECHLGACRRVVAPGDACGEGVVCLAGSTCTAVGEESRCVSNVLLGDRCDPSPHVDPGCPRASVCAKRDDTARCTPAAVGDPCWGRCRSVTLACTSRDGWNEGRCIAYAHAGDPCAADAECPSEADALFCDATRHCAPLPRAGKPCAATEAGLACDPWRAWCDTYDGDPHCAPLLKSGATCVHAEACGPPGLAACYDNGRCLAFDAACP